MSIYFVRHGQTDWNRDHKIMGRSDIPLNETGIQQAAEIRDKLRDISFELILSSPLSRAEATAKIIAEAHPDTPVAIATELSERDFGEYEGMENKPGADYYGVWDYKRERIHGSGETLKDLEARVYPFLDDLYQTYAHTNILLVAHGGIGLVIRAYFRGIPESGNLLELPPVANGEFEILNKQ